MTRPVDAKDIERVARKLLPYLESLLQAKRQAEKQFKMTNGEHKQTWYDVVSELDKQIARVQDEVEQRLDIIRLRRLDNGS